MSLKKTAVILILTAGFILSARELFFSGGLAHWRKLKSPEGLVLL